LSQTAANSEAVVRVQGLHVALEGRPILREVNLTVQAGQLVAVIGPNGSGKTTLLRCLLGLQKPDGGLVRLFGEDDLRQALPKVGYVPQRLTLERGFILSVREFLALRCAETKGWFWRSARRTDDFVGAALPELGLEPLLDRPLAKLSGGQLQRVLVAFSLLHRPELLLLDEPTAGVDSPGGQTFYDLIAQVHQQRRMTIILVSHDLSLVYRHASWVYALNQTVCCEGPPEKVLNAESLRAAYGIHVAPYHHVH
jgi:ABC-type Mn2+/Zn2+ transport system ATPase subunit